MFDAMQELPFDCVLVTDDLSVLSRKGWQVVHVQKTNRPKFQQRRLKACPHKVPVVQDYKYSLYIDGNLKRSSNVNAFLIAMHRILTPLLSGTVPLVCFMHPVRNSAIQEAHEIRRAKLCSNVSLDRALSFHKSQNRQGAFQLTETNVLARAHQLPKVIAMGETWIHLMEQVKCHRDQLFFDFSRWKLNVPVVHMAHAAKPFIRLNHPDKVYHPSTRFNYEPSGG